MIILYSLTIGILVFVTCCLFNGLIFTILRYIKENK